MANLMKLAIVAALAWGAYTYGWPSVQRWLNDPGTGMAGTPGVEKCARSARAAVEYFGDQVGRFASSAPPDKQAWASAEGATNGRIRTARQACVCEERGCDEISAALDRFGDLVQDFDHAIQRDQPLHNPGARVARIFDQIDAAERRQEQ